jgi:putative ABC transport system substrate-binding protein
MTLCRRDFITLLGGAAAAWPLAARAQYAPSVKRLTILADAGEADSRDGFAAFRQGLERSGWIEGRNLRSTIRSGDGEADRIRALAVEVVRTSPDLIFANGGTAVTALLRETRVLPILFVSPGDPVATGLVASLAHPGGNATGFTAYEGSIGTKWVELLKELAPAARQLLVLNPGNPNSTVLLPAIEKVAGSFALALTVATVAAPAEIERAIETAARAGNVGMIVLPGSFNSVHRDLITALAAGHQIPTIFGDRRFVTAGGLASYGAEQVGLYRQAASYADRLLRGEKPADLPVQAATRFEFVLNLKTATMLGLTVPQTLLVAADEVIE